MKITYKQLLTSVPSFKELQEFKFPPRTSLDIYKLGKELDKELETYRDLSKEIYKRHEIPEKDGGFDLRDVKEETFKALSEDLEELMSAEIDLRDASIPIEIFERFNLPVSTNMFISLDWLIKLEEDAPKEGEVKLPHNTE